MSIAKEALREAAIWTGLLLALPGFYCAAVIVKAAWKEVRGRCRGKHT